MKSILQLSDDCYMDFSVVQTPEFVPDEIEVWLHINEKDICIFKDSKQYVLQVECRSVVNSVEKSIGPYLTSEEILSTIYSFNEEIFKYALFEYRDIITTISSYTEERLLLCIVRYDLSNIPELLFSFVVRKEDFTCWFNSLCE